MENHEIAELLLKVASLLELRNEVTPHRVRAFQQAAFKIEALERPVAEIVRAQGREGLEKLERLSPGVAAEIDELVNTGRSTLIEQLAEELGPEARFQTVPGIGATLAKRIRHDLRINTLEELEGAARIGRLAEIPGIGAGKAAQILEGIERLRERGKPAEDRSSESKMDNREIAEVLFKAASLLNLREDTNPFRVQAYRRAAASIQALDRPVTDILREEGVGALDKIPNVGPGIAARIEELLSTGRLALIDQLADELGPEALFQTVSGIGPTLAKRIRQELNISTLEELETAARTGQLENVPGIGTQKEKQIVEGIERNRARVREAQQRQPAPLVEELLDVDGEYRRKAEAGELETIAPKKENPTGEKWLPILHTTRGPHRYTAVYSNTRAAHEAGKTKDWVVLYWSVGRQGEEEQCTVVTETQGEVKGLRVIRGREDECRVYYAEHGVKQAA